MPFDDLDKNIEPDTLVPADNDFGVHKSRPPDWDKNSTNLVLAQVSHRAMLIFSKLKISANLYFWSQREKVSSEISSDEQVFGEQNPFE